MIYSAPLDVRMSRVKRIKVGEIERLVCSYSGKVFYSRRIEVQYDVFSGNPEGTRMSFSMDAEEPEDLEMGVPVVAIREPEPVAKVSNFECSQPEVLEAIGFR